MNPIVEQHFRFLQALRAVREVTALDLAIRFTVTPIDHRAELLAVLFVDGLVTAEALAAGVSFVHHHTPDPARDLPLGLWSALLRVAGLTPAAVSA